MTVLVAVSGGADSIALLRGLASLGRGPGGLVVAHFNHGLRAEESEGDQRFVSDLCQQLGIPFAAGRWWPERRPNVPVLPSEQAARRARYKFLEQTALERGARFVATAHTADDQAETILHRILRGTGLTGLAGIRRTRPLGPAVTLIRPMLDIRRQTVLDYLAALGQLYRHDATNRDRRFTRNRIRYELIPHLEEQYNPRVVDAILRLGNLAAEVQEIVQQQVEQLAEECVVPSGTVALRIPRLAAEPEHLLRELLLAVWRRQGWPLQAMTDRHWRELAALLRAGDDALPPPQEFPGAIRAERVPGELRLTPLKPPRMG